MSACPKPERRVKDRHAGRTKLLLEGRCRACGRSYGIGVSMHHLVNRSQGGDDVADNLVPLCGDGTRGCHGALTDHRRGWERIAAALRHNLTPAEKRYIITHKSAEWLDTHYPEAS